MEVYQSPSTGEIGTDSYWIEKIIDHYTETGERLSLHGEIEAGRLVRVFLELSNHKMGNQIGGSIEWLTHATDYEGNRYSLIACAPVGESPDWEDSIIEMEV